MSILNPKRTESRRTPESHKNWMGGKSFQISPILRLRTAAASCFFGEPQYYHVDKADKRKRREGSPPLHQFNRLDPRSLSHLRETLGAIDRQEWRELSPANMLERAIDEALESDPEATLRVAVELRQKLNIRTTPQVIMVRAAHNPKVKGTDLISRYGQEIMQRLDEPTVQMAYWLSTYGKPFPSRIKRAWKKRLERAKPYELAKYRMDGHAVNLYDVVNVTQPASDAVSRLMKGQAKQSGKTWEAVRSAAGKVKTKTEAKKVWSKSAEKMGHMALLRNLRNLEQNGALTDALLSQLIEGVDRGRQLPFRYFSAFKALGHARPAVLDAVEECLERSFRHAPKFPGRVMSLTDNSGSTHGSLTSKMGTMTFAEIGNLMGVMTAKMAEEGWLGVFGDTLRTRPVRKKSSIFDEIKTAQALGRHVGGNTEAGIWHFWRDAIEKREHWDHVFIYSDNQAGYGELYGHGGMGWCPRWERHGYGVHFVDVPELISRYRNKVNRNVNVYLVQVAGYQDTLIPEFYDRTYILGGWSEHVLQFADYMGNIRLNG